MPILDGFPQTAGDVKAAARLASALFEREATRRGGLTPRMRSVVDLLGEGLSLADILEITPEERDAVLLTGCRQLQLGDYEGARAMLKPLVLMEPTDARAIYALAVAHQALHEPVVAGKFLLHAIALDATNPEPYLRLGECFLADRDVEGARACFVSAKILADGERGTPAQAAHADLMLSTLPAPT